MDWIGVQVGDAPERDSYLSLLDAEQPELWHTGGQDPQRGFGHGRLVQAELRETRGSRLQVQHHPRIGHFGLVQGQETQALQPW